MHCLLAISGASQGAHNAGYPTHLSVPNPPVITLARQPSSSPASLSLPSPSASYSLAPGPSSRP